MNSGTCVVHNCESTKRYFEHRVYFDWLIQYDNAISNVQLASEIDTHISTIDAYLPSIRFLPPSFDANGPLDLGMLNYVSIVSM